MHAYFFDFPSPGAGTYVVAGATTVARIDACPRLLDDIDVGTEFKVVDGRSWSIVITIAAATPGKRCGATAQSALGWYRPSVGVPETLDGKPSGVLV